MTEKNEMIKRLRAEAAEAGDAAMVVTCIRALAGDHEAEAECLEVIAYAEGEAEDDDGPELCGLCNGSGEGMADGTRCPVCRGTGEEIQEPEVDPW